MRFWFACCRSPEGRISTFSCPSWWKQTRAAAQPPPRPPQPQQPPGQAAHGAPTSSAFSRSSRPSSSSTSSKSSPSKLRERHTRRTCGRAALTRPEAAHAAAFPPSFLPSLPPSLPACLPACPRPPPSLSPSLSLTCPRCRTCCPAAPPDRHFRQQLPAVAVTPPELVLRRCRGDRRRFPRPAPPARPVAAVAMEAAGIPGCGGVSAAGRPARYSTGTRELVRGKGGAGRGRAQLLGTPGSRAPCLAPRPSVPPRSRPAWNLPNPHLPLRAGVVRGGDPRAGSPARLGCLCIGTLYFSGMMEELQMTHSQKRYLMAYVTRGDALPLQRFPPSSQQPVPVPHAAACQPGRLPARPLLRPAKVCQAGDAYSREKFKPQPTRDLEKEKRRLQKILALGKDEVEDKVEQVFVQKKEEEIAEPDRFEELMNEIQERREFLAEMEALGQGKKYQGIVLTEISQKLHEMEIIDKKYQGVTKQQGNRRLFSITVGLQTQLYLRR
uniref:EVG1 protein n=1 Tax=Zonotrichia albicollis TaxID=44394 RepID=A0A8D2MHN1_ZONAL